MKTKIQFLAGFFLSLTLLMQSCNFQKKTKEEGTWSAKDSRGKVVSLDKPAARVVVLFEPAVDEIYMLQAGACIVGLPQQVYQNEDTYSFLSRLDTRIADKSIATPTFGGRSGNMETIVGLKPDLIVVYEQDQETISQLEGLGIPVFTVSSLNKEKIYSELQGLGTLLGKKGRARALINYADQETRKMSSPIDGKLKKVYYAWSKGRIFSTSGRGTLIDLAIRVAGAENACPLTMESPNVGAEALYKWNPDLILLWNSRLEEVYNLKELAALPAVKNKQVFVMNPAFSYDPHTIKFILFAKQLRHWCYPAYTAQQLRADMKTAFFQLYGKNDLMP